MNMKKYKISNFLLIVYFFSINFEMFNLYGIGSPARLAGFLYFFSILPYIDKFLSIRHILKYIIPWIIYFTLLFIVSLLNVNEYSSFSQIFDTTFLFNLLLFIALINHEERQPGILEKGFLSFILSNCLMTVLYFFGIGVTYDLGRVSVFGDNENAIGIRLSIALILFFYFSLIKSNLKKIRLFVILLLAPLMLRFLIDTGSRSAFFSLIGALAVGTVFRKTKRISQKILTLSIGIVLVVYAGKLMQETEAFTKRINKIEEDGLIASRQEVWTLALNIIEINPVFGVGKTGYTKHSFNFENKYRSPHNVFLEVWAFSGMIGLLSFIFFIYSISAKSFYLFKQNKILPSLLLFPIFAMLITGHILGTKIIWAIFAYIISSKLSKNYEEV